MSATPDDVIFQGRCDIIRQTLIFAQDCFAGDEYRSKFNRALDALNVIQGVEPQECTLCPGAGCPSPATCLVEGCQQ